MRVVLLGPPGVGKGTQGRLLASARAWPLISTGEMLREAVARRTELGTAARAQMDAGLLVSDDVMIGLVQERTAQSDAARGFILDGFPRTVAQAEALDAMLAGRGELLDAALALDLPEAELVRRLTGRRECPVCQRSYNLHSAPSKDGRHCDDHPEAELRQRPDDAPETVLRRIGVYELQTAPLLGYYRTRGKLSEVEGVGTMDEVRRGLCLALDRVQAER